MSLEDFLEERQLKEAADIINQEMIEGIQTVDNICEIRNNNNPTPDDSMILAILLNKFENV